MISTLSQFPPIRHLFFDLDRTIWDYETNCRETLDDLHEQLLVSRGVKSADQFASIFRRENRRLWEAYIGGTIDKQVLRKHRFLDTIRHFNLYDEQLAEILEQEYIEVTPLKKRLMPGAAETLNELSQRYTLHIITNGFEDVQHFKLENCGIREYFGEVITSDAAGSCKPHRAIFDYSLKRAGASVAESMMIGDDPHADIAGARDAGWRTVLYNSSGIPHTLEAVTEIGSLPELREILYPRNTGLET